MKKIQLSAIGFLTLFSLTACYGTVGSNFNSSQIKIIQSNVTSQEEILEKFGTPFKKGVENAQTMWTYQFDKWNVFGPAQSKDLVILFNSKNIVKAYRYTTSNTNKP